MNELEISISMDAAQNKVTPADLPQVKLQHIARTFLGIGLAQLLPGAPTVNLSSYLGFRLRGLPGAAVSTIFFLIPCFSLMLLLSHLYFQYGETSMVSGLFRGLGALVVGLVFNTVLNLWKSGVRTIFNWLMALVGFAMVFWFKVGIVKILLIVGSASLIKVLLNIRFPTLALWTERGVVLRKNGAISAPWAHPGRNSVTREEPDYASACSHVPLDLYWPKITLHISWLVLFLAGNLALIYQRPELMRMCGSFLRIGALTFGSGYAMLPFIQDTVVTQFGWLTDQQFAVALALSLITPGPVTIICVFIGYQVAGIAGAAAGMLNMYFPAWAMTTLVTIPYAKAGQAVRVKQVISSIVAAFIGTLVVVLLKLSMDTLMDASTIALAAGAFVIQRFVKVDTVWIVLSGALVSLAIFH